MGKKHALFAVLAFLMTSRTFGLENVVVVILSQPNQYHADLAEKLRQEIHEQADDLNQPHPLVQLSHQDFPHIGAWTVLPILPKLAEVHGKNSTWIVFVEDRTRIRLKNLYGVLKKYSHQEEIWLGHGLYDEEPTIIHHFAFYENSRNFKYPNIASGFAISNGLLQRLTKQLQEKGFNSDFSIDAAHELALFIWDSGDGPEIIHEVSFCAEEDAHNKLECAAFPATFQQCNEGTPPTEAIYFAVKTCGKFHKNRVAVVKRTWAQYASRLRFFSDVRDESIPTVFLGVPNTENGHCGKTLAIIKYVFEETKNDPLIKWVVVADDDTILSVYRMQQLLSCHNASSLIALGERYGYNVHNNRGYNYITGGGGMVFTKPLIELMVTSGKCRCPSISSPDDMYIGVCLANLGVSITHSPLFHQARPVDYATGYLKTDDAISFHKHWMIDPISVYQEWFADDDHKLAETFNKHTHREL